MRLPHKLFYGLDTALYKNVSLPLFCLLDQAKCLRKVAAAYAHVVEENFAAATEADF